MNLFDWIRLIILSLLWGGSYIWIEYALLTISPLTIFFRVFMAALFLLGFCLILKLDFKINKRLFFIFLLMSLFNNVIPFNLIAWGQSQITASVSSILNATTPLFTVIIANYWPKPYGENATLNKIVGVIIGICGVSVLMGFSFNDIDNSITGQIAILLAAVSYAISVLFGKQISSNIHPAVSASMMLCISSIILMPIILFVGFDFESKIGILDWSILLSIILLLFIVYIPKSIWAEEQADKDESRFRMKTISNAAKFYHELKGNYTSDGEQMFALVEAAIDSLYADSLFVGEQEISVNNFIHNIKIERGFDYRADTTFSIAEKIKSTLVDTIYMISEYKDSVEKVELDTLYVNSANIKAKQALSTFNAIINTEINERVEVVNNYLRKKYHLNPNLLICPLTNRKYIIEVLKNDGEDDIFLVKSPVKQSDSESRYLFFKYDPGNHGYIRDGITSWAE